MATVVKSFAIQGIDGYPVDIEIKTLEGQPTDETRCQVPLNFYKQTNTYLQIVNVVVE